ncbi:MAG: hypothetical protein SWE60_01235 [Thermodesulfobacteriota bacterium]|nr:hypothetical protein [Thermodesulfobacteriota bacterium]
MSEDFDRVLLFTHPNDVIPILAFAVNSSQPVIVENHAHFSFWLGTSIADVVICHFPRMVQAAFQRRRVNNPFFFPMVIIDERAERYSHLTKQEAKKMIGLDESSICILTVGTREKFLPNHGYNFFSTAKKITQRYPNAWILIIGLSPDDALVQRQLGKHPPRIRMLGVTDTPFLHYKAADIFMESFPLSSLGAVQDSIHYGDACPLYAYGTNRGLLSSHAVYNKDMFGTIIPEIYTEEKYLQYLGELIADLPLRRKIVNHAKANLARIWSQHGTYRRTLFELADSLQHTPHAIRHGIVEVQSDDVNVAGLSRHKTLKEVSTYFRRSSLEFSPRDNLTLALLLIRKGVFVKEALISIVACLVNAATAFLCSK